MPPKPAFSNDSHLTYVRKCLVFPSETQEPRFVDMTIRTVTEEDTSIVRLYNRTVDLVATYGSEYRKLRVWDLSSYGGVPGKHLLYYNMSPKLPLNRCVARIVGINPDEPGSRLFWRGDVVVMGFESHDDCSSYINCQNADTSVTGAVEEMLRDAYMEGSLEQWLSADESMWANYSSKYCHWSTALSATITGYHPYWGKNWKRQEGAERVQWCFCAMSYAAYSWSGTKLYYICNTAEADQALSTLSLMSPGPLGFDLEWRPNKIKGAPENPVALVQLASKEVVLLIHVIRMSEFPKKLQEILENPRIVKAGVGIENDVDKLFRSYRVSMRNGVDLSHLARHVDGKIWPGSQPIGLVRLVKEYENRSLSKDASPQRSDWAAELSRDQQIYAANDAHASFAVYTRLQPILKSTVPIFKSFNYVPNHHKGLDKPSGLRLKESSYPIIEYHTEYPDSSTTALEFLRTCYRVTIRIMAVLLRTIYRLLCLFLQACLGLIVLGATLLLVIRLTFGPTGHSIT